MDSERPTSSTKRHMPPEVVGRILLLGSPKDRKERFQFLSLASEVCTTWKAEAQRLLWSAVRIRSAADALQVLSSPKFGKYTTPSLVVESQKESYLLGDWEGDVLYQVLEGLVGVVKLEFVGICDDFRLDLEILRHPSLAEVKSLNIRSVHIEAADPSYKYGCLFPKLEQLLFVQFGSSRNFDFDHLYSTFASSHLTEFTNLQVPDTPHDFVPFMKSVGPQLKYLSLGAGPPPHLRKCFSSCTTLTKFHLFTFVDDFMPLVNQLPPTGSLKHFIISSSEVIISPVSMEKWVKAWDTLIDLPSMKGLETLDLSVFSKSKLMGTVGGVAVLAKLYVNIREVKLGW